MSLFSKKLSKSIKFNKKYLPLTKYITGKGYKTKNRAMHYALLTHTDPEVIRTIEKEGFWYAVVYVKFECFIDKN
jgi:hypothetical protein